MNAPAMPRTVAFYRAADDRPSPGWQVVAWGLRHPDGWIAVVSADAPRMVSIWSTVHEAEVALEAFVDVPRPPLDAPTP